MLPFAFCIGLYLITLTGVHTYDALSYILDVDRKPWPELFHPHHLAYGPLGALIRGVAGALGWQGSAGRLLQAANALAGAAGVGLFALVVRRASARADLALLGGLLLGSSYAFWYYAVEVEVYTIAALFLIGCLGLMLELSRRPSLGLAAALGLCQGLAVLFHQTNVLLCAPALALLLAAARRPGPRLPALLAAYGAPLALVVGGAYLGVGLGLSGFRSWAALYAWAAGYTTTGWWGGPVGGESLAGLAKGLSDTLARPGGALFGLGLLGLLALNLRGLAAAPRPTVAALLCWLLVYGAFFLWWEPDNSEFWIASLPPFYLLLLLAVAGRARQGERGTGGAGAKAGGGERAGGRVMVGVLLALGVAMLWVNFFSIRLRGDPARDLQRSVAAALAERSAPGDLLVVPDGLQELYLPYYAGRFSVASLTQAMTAAGAWPAACDELRARVDNALASGFAVMLADEALRPPPAPPGEPPSMAERFGLAPETVAACYEPYAAALEPVALGPGLPAYRRIAAAQELADGPGWDFRRGRWGWRAINAEPTDGAGRGWALRPGLDPALYSPPLQIDAARYGAIELRLSSAAAGRAQLFFLDAAGQADEARSIRWELQPGPGARTYTLPLRGAPGWAGTVSGLRLDPLEAGDGGDVVLLESIRLLP